jgi:RNA polymerase sigma factor (sigma-70 family)
MRLRSDDQLVALFRMGYEEAFEAIFERYRQRLFNYTRQMLSRSRSDAEDALQDVFLRAHVALRQDDRPVTLRAWLYRVAHNRCVDQIRRPALVPRDVFDVSRAPLQDPLALVERREDMRRLFGDIRRLPDHQRSALFMREAEGMSYAEIADALGVTVKAVKALLARARMGLTAADAARNAACCDIRAELALAFDRGVRMSGRSRAHLRECDGCRRYRVALRGVRSDLGALAPGHGVVATIAKLLGLGGAGSGAAVGGGAALGGGLAVKAAAIGAGALVASGVGYEGVKQIRHASSAPNRAVAAKPAPVTPAPVAPSFHDESAATDLKPFRRASVKARRTHHGRPAVTRVHPVRAHGRVHREVSPLPPSRIRTHDLKPVNPRKPASPGQSTQHRQQGQVHKRPKRTKPTPKSTHGRTP